MLKMALLHTPESGVILRTLRRPKKEWQVERVLLFVLKWIRSKAYSIQDGVRGKVDFPANMVGDFVIMRSSGIPTYNFSNVIDDHQHEINHVLRAEEHLNNTVRQLNDL
jgi:glutamyl/glutaminyl-tRNA synthetase